MHSGGGLRCLCHVSQYDRYRVLSGRFRGQPGHYTMLLFHQRAVPGSIASTLRGHHSGVLCHRIIYNRTAVHLTVGSVMESDFLHRFGIVSNCKHSPSVLNLNSEVSDKEKLEKDSSGIQRHGKEKWKVATETVGNIGTKNIAVKRH